MISPFWKKHIYRCVFIGCGIFVLLTVAAMFTYPGGTYTGELTNRLCFDYQCDDTSWLAYHFQGK